MVLALGPVQTQTRHRLSPRGVCLSDFGEPFVAERGQLALFFGDRRQEPPLPHGPIDFHSQFAGQMVVACPGITKDPDFLWFSIANPRRWSQFAERLERGAYSGSGDAIVAVPALVLDAEQSALDQFCEVAAGSLRSHVGAKSQLTGGEGSPIEQ